MANVLLFVGVTDVGVTDVFRRGNSKIAVGVNHGRPRRSNMTPCSLNGVLNSSKKPSLFHHDYLVPHFIALNGHFVVEL